MVWSAGLSGEEVEASLQRVGWEEAEGCSPAGNIRK